MSDVIDFWRASVPPGAWPRRNSRYQAYGVQLPEDARSLTLIRSDGSEAAFPYAMLGPMFFDASALKGAGKDACRLEIAFCQVRGIPFGGDRRGFHVTVTGRKLRRLFSDLGRHNVHWIWALPQDRSAPEGDGPVVHSIGIEPVSDVSAIVPKDVLETARPFGRSVFQRIVPSPHAAADGDISNYL